MLRQLSFKNYKAFKTRQTIDIKPFTLLLGPNSAGKSSIIKLIGLLKQSILAKDTSHDVFLYNGTEVQAKSFENISHNHKSNPIEVSFINDIYRQGIIEPESELEFWSSIPEEANIVREKINFYLKTSTELRKDHIHVDYFKGSKGKYSNLDTFYGNYSLTRKSHKNLIEKLEKKILTDLSPMIDYCVSNNCVSGSPTATVILVDSGKEYTVPGVNEDDPEKRIQSQIYGLIRVKGDITYEWEARSFLPYQIDHTRRIHHDYEEKYFEEKVDFNIFPPDWNFHEGLPPKYLNYTNSELLARIKEHWHVITLEPDLSRESVRKNIEAQFYRYAELIAERAYHKLRNTFAKSETRIDMLKLSLTTTFDRIKFFPALRPNPKQYYNEQELYEIFGIRPEYFNPENYTSAFKTLGYNYKIILEKLSEDHDVYALFFQHPSSKVKVTLSEMGYGFSQVLPYLSGSSLLTILEQPELHLHPKAQAAFPSILNNTTNHIIETHSEHILRGIQIEVAKGNISHSDVAVYFVGKRKNGNSYVEELKLDDKGKFKNKFPEGFFDTGFKQAMALMKAR